ncbi:hypothetical protein RchiOBHm_Chr6g0290121 [Rosa chinensis]|uniref:Uncharacterized protein n=1 Tax=Rosa chinensis TaxID=74649 RepID=A0A2P6PVS9_ROSCH|nr:hypothetical protein RchiOBHm_Chr6g0290121 [Rosa chinensis]
MRLAGKTPSEAVAVRQLLGHRLPLDARQAKSEWCYCGGVLSQSMTLWKERALLLDRSNKALYIGRPFELFWFIFRIRMAGFVHHTANSEAEEVS